MNVSRDNTLGRKIKRTFRLVFGQEFAAKWAAHSWSDAPTKFIITPNCGIVFLGFENEPNGQRQGFLIPADEALVLAELLSRHAKIANQLGEPHD